jgi:hypothetical protein
MSKYFCKSCVSIIKKRINYLKKLNKKCNTPNDYERGLVIQQLEYLLEMNTKG